MGGILRLWKSICKGSRYILRMVSAINPRLVSSAPNWFPLLWPRSLTQVVG